MLHKKEIAAAALAALVAGAGVATYGVIQSSNHHATTVAVSSPAKPASGVAVPLPATPPTPGTSTTATPVPGTNSNQYAAGPFTITLQNGLPFDATVQEQVADVVVKNTSTSFTGTANPTVEFSQNGAVLGSNSEASAVLAPGQSETVAVPYTFSSQGYVSTQLTDLFYGPGSNVDAFDITLAH